MRRLLHIAFALLVVTVGMAGCKDDSTSMVSHATDPEKVPTMTTSDVQTVISDSGHTRYRIAAPSWNMFEEAKEPHWTFPEGVTCEELDNNYNTVSTIKCDSAYFDKNKSLWKLVGNVHITNVSGDIVTTDELMWDQHLHKLYSNAFIHIEKQGRIIEGYGYESNERLTTYQLRQVEAIFPIDERRMPHPNSGNAPQKMR
ncbi:MAG: LPS export ABC transporter periplasmic protein LptC [Muribaculaceae bacterium]|nr:LPS export ABC transporter periplasmic protein LptC [Muribaculaceae bacterium]